MEQVLITCASGFIGKMIRYWDGGNCPVDVRDVAMGHLLALDKGKIGESYILGNTSANMSFKDLLTLMGNVSGSDMSKMSEISGKSILRFAKLAGLWSRISGRPPITTTKETLFSLKHCYFDASKAVQELGLPQTPIETSITDAADWFKQNGYV